MGRKIFSLLVAVSFLYIASPFFLPIAMGGVFAVLFRPWLDRAEKRGMSRLVASSLITVGATILVILPMSFLIFFAAKNGFLQLQSWKLSPVPSKGLLDSLLDHPSAKKMILWMSDYSPVEVSDFGRVLHELAASIGTKLAEILGTIITQLPGMLLSMIMMVLSIYFCLIDGRRLLLFLRKNSFFAPKPTEQLIQTIGDICRSVVLAALVSGGLQSLVQVFACVITGTPNVALIGLSVFIASFIPIVGSLPVTLFVAFQQYLVGHTGQGVILLVTGVLIFGLDNAVRSVFLRGSTNLHPFLAFVAAIGGLQTLGFVGVFIGPICASLFLMTVQILVEKDDPVIPLD